MTKKQKTIVLVDDETDILDLLEESLIDKGHNIFKFSSVKKLNKSFQEIEPTIFIVDLAIGKEDGFELIAGIRSLYNSIPVYVISGYPNLLNDSRLIDLGVIEVLEKPFCFLELANRVHSKIS